jgi:hypothetical protein
VATGARSGRAGDEWGTGGECGCGRLGGTEWSGWGGRWRPELGLVARGTSGEREGNAAELNGADGEGGGDRS